MASSPTPDAVALIAADGAALSVARALLARGARVTLIEADAWDATRSREGLTKAGLDIAVVTADDALPAVDLALAGPAAPEDALPRIVARLGVPALAVSGDAARLDGVAAALPDPSILIGLTFHMTTAAPSLAEIVPRHATSDAARAAVRGLVAAAGLRSIETGGTGMRLMLAMMEAADTLLIEGATPWEIDEAMVDFGFSIGPYELQDLVGMDAAHAARRRRGLVSVADRAVEEGRLGKKAGVGWYRYPGGGGAVIDPLVEDLIREESHFAGISPREIADDEVRDRLLSALVNEGARLLEEGVARQADDIDLIAVHGLAFPEAQGGPLVWADRVGLQAVLDMLEDVAGPAPLLERLAETGRGFHDAQVTPSRAAEAARG